MRGTHHEIPILRDHDHAADAVKRALPAARVGGPEIAGMRTPQAARFLLEGSLTWAFELEDQPYFTGFRVLVTGGDRFAGLECLPDARADGRAPGESREQPDAGVETLRLHGVRQGPEIMALGGCP